MQAQVYSTEGNLPAGKAGKAGVIELPEGIFGLPWNGDLVKQVVDSLMSSKRKNIAHAKTRGEVRGGGRKPWQQKGTGRARHGSTRSPIWVGGGVAHGPRNDKNYDRTVSKKMRIKALHTLLSKKHKDGEIIFLDSLSLPEAKTKMAISTLKTLPFEVMKKRKNALAIALADKNRETERAFKNIGNVQVLEARNLDPLTLLQYKYLVLENPDKAIKVLPNIKHD
ncbi:MAG TPA: 50S ribosomal protein L4 [Candidatus Paceibacterota bacterium]